jgi:hypothetical protein
MFTLHSHINTYTSANKKQISSNFSSLFTLPPPQKILLKLFRNQMKIFFGTKEFYKNTWAKFSIFRYQNCKPKYLEKDFIIFKHGIV